MVGVIGVQYTDTITLGAILLGAAVSLAALATFFYGVRWKVEAAMRDETIRTLNESRDAFAHRCEELGAEKDACQQQVSALRAELDTLKQLPRYDDVVRLNQETLKHVDEQAASRQNRILEVLVERLEKHDEHVAVIAGEGEKRAQERHDKQLAVLEAIEKRLRNGGK